MRAAESAAAREAPMTPSQAQANAPEQPVHPGHHTAIAGRGTRNCSVAK
jgi:hypothetical protein